MFWESLYPLFKWCEGTWAGVAIRDSTWAFPIIETFHLFGLTVLLGAIVMVSLRLLGLTARHQPVSEVARQLAPWTLGGLAVMLTTGSLLFASEAMKCYDSGPFRIKMVFLFLAIVFHFTLYRKVTRADDGRLNPLWTKLTGGLALTLWFSVGLAGRAIGFF